MAPQFETLHELSPACFHAETSSVLVATQAQSRRVISRIARAFEAPENYQLFAVYQEAAVVGAICFELSRSYICAAGSVSVETARTLLAALCDEAGGKITRLQGCDGPPMVVDAISIACEESFGCSARLTDSLETMTLDTEPRPCPGVAGALRSVAPGSKLMPILAQWFEQFEKDTGNDDFSSGGRSQVMAHLSEAADRRNLFTWEVKDKPVAMVILGRSQPKQVLCVYTPPHQRGRGYGQAVTAAVCADCWQKTGGKEPIILSAVHKFGAARVYDRVGFRSTGWLHGVIFEDQCFEVARATAGGKCDIHGSDVETDTETDETDAEDEDDEETHEDIDWLDWLDLETDPAKLFACSSTLLECQ